jgi:hypothetical protein
MVSKVAWARSLLLLEISTKECSKRVPSADMERILGKTANNTLACSRMADKTAKEFKRTPLVRDTRGSGTAGGKTATGRTGKATAPPMQVSGFRIRGVGRASKLIETEVFTKEDGFSIRGMVTAAYQTETARGGKESGTTM